MGSTRPAAVSEPDAADIAASLAGDGDAFARIVRRYQGEIGLTLWRFSRDRAVWEELVHDVFVEAYLGLPSYRGRAPLIHWLRKIATRVGYRHWKRAARERALSQGSLEEARVREIPANDPAESTETAAKLLHETLSRLPPRDRLVLTLLYFEECSVQETAERTGWSRAMVKVQAFRARKKLRKLLETSKGG